MAIFLFIFFLMMIAYAFLIEYYRRAWNQLPVFNDTDSIYATTISIIIAVRNEERNIQELLESLNNLHYPKTLYQVIIVDDHSTDNTWVLLQQASFPELSTTFLKLSNEAKEEEIKSHKKKAIETGIKIASGKLIVTSDADCRFHPQWLLTIASFYESTKAKFIAAPVKINAGRSLIEIFQTLDFITLQGITGASVHKRFHSMCNGANLAYEKEVFYEVNGFAGIDKIPSGDDMLLMHKIYKKYPAKVFYLKSPLSIVTTTPVSNWKEFFNQRIRWASKADSYEDKRIFWVLLLVYLINVFFLILFIAAFFKSNWLLFLILLLITKIIIEFPFVNTVAIFFNQQSLMKYFPLLQPLHILYTIAAGWLGKFSSYNWKGRQIKK